MPDLALLVDRVPAGWTRVTYGGRPYGLTRTDHADGRSVSLYAEELGGSDVVSTNVFRTATEDLLRPCEMSAAKVLDFLVSWTDAGQAARSPSATAEMPASTSA